MIIQAWRTEELFRSHVGQLLIPALDETGLAAAEPQIAPAWSIARP
jgi:hypothetical protein